ncbi:MAG: hypothetical protein AB8B46_00720 [Candidatus Midichloriaceae bacterium]
MSSIFIIIILSLVGVHLKEQNEKIHNDNLAEIEQTHVKFQEKIKNIEILLNILGRVIIENNYSKPEKIYSVFSKYINYYEKHLNIATKHENPLLIQFLNKYGDIKVDRFSGITECKSTDLCLNLIDNTRKESWKIHFDNTNKTLLKDDYVSSLLFGLADKKEEYFGILLVHLNKENISNLINYSGLIIVLDKECKFIFSNKSMNTFNLKKDDLVNYCKSINNVKNIGKIDWHERKNMPNLYNLKYKDLILIFEPNKRAYSINNFYSAVINEAYIGVFIVMIVLFLINTFLYILHSKIKKQEEQFDSYVNNKSYNKTNFSYVLEKVKNLSQSIVTDQEKTDELELIGELIPIVSQNINDNIYRTLSFIDEHEENYSDKGDNKLKSAADYSKLFKFKSNTSIYKNFLYEDNHDFTLAKSKILLKEFLENILGEINEYGVNFTWNKECNNNSLIFGDKNLIKIMLFELLTEFYENADLSNIKINLQREAKLKKVSLVIKGRLNLEEIHKKIIKIDFPRSTAINSLLFLSKGLLYEKFIMKIHNGSLKIKKNDKVIVTKLLFDEI